MMTKSVFHDTRWRRQRTSPVNNLHGVSCKLIKYRTRHSSTGKLTQEESWGRGGIVPQRRPSYLIRKYFYRGDLDVLAEEAKAPSWPSR